MYLVKAGESHGEAMVGVLCNVPSGVVIDKKFINAMLKARSQVLGRSVRQSLERDKINLLTGVRNGVSLGNNIAFVVKNAVHGDYKSVMDCFNADTQTAKITALRPGHADLGGIYRTGFSDARNVMEGASARNTCLDVIGGSIALSMLNMLGISVGVRVRSLGNLTDDKKYTFEQTLLSKAPAYSLNKKFVSDCKNLINHAKEVGDSLGGSVQITISPIKKGFGFYLPEKRVNSVIAQHIMDIQSVKGVYFGENPFDFCYGGLNYHGNIVKNKNGDLLVKNSLSGGIDGGMTNGDVIKITVGIKPLPTTQKGLETVDIQTGESTISAKERSDITAVFALCPILQSVVATALTQIISERIGCDNMQNIIKRYSDL